MPSLETPTFSSNGKSWIDRLLQAWGGEPKSRTELLDMLREAANRDLLSLNSLTMIEGVLEVHELQVDEIMVPRFQMVILENDMTFDKISDIVVQSGHSRFPVIGENKDEVLGILLAKDLLVYLSEEARQKFNIRDVLRPAIFVPESKRLDVLLQEFRDKRYHIAIVVDEYGGVTGLVTIEDVLEQIVGDIADEFDVDEGPMIRQYTESNYTIKALIPIKEFNEYFNTQIDEAEVETLGGLITRKLGHLPKRGEGIEVDGFLFKIIRADSRRVYTIKVTPKRMRASLSKPTIGDSAP